MKELIEYSGNVYEYNTDAVYTIYIVVPSKSVFTILRY